MVRFYVNIITSFLKIIKTKIEKSKLTDKFSDGTIVRISHIGSTAIPGIISKPTIDILMEISPDSDISRITAALKSMDWILMNSSDKPIFKQSYNKGYTKYGFAQKVYHLHVRYPGDWNELYFRDYLIEHPHVAQEYVDLKKQLKEKYEHNREAYTDGKEAFVSRYSEIAKVKYKDRYKISVA